MLFIEWGDFEPNFKYVSYFFINLENIALLFMPHIERSEWFLQVTM